MIAKRRMRILDRLAELESESDTALQALRDVLLELKRSGRKPKASPEHEDALRRLLGLETQIMNLRGSL